MGLFDKWLESLDYQFHVSSLCSRYQSTRSTCQKCIDICLFDAIHFQNGTPVIDQKKCTECGYCITECPQNAIEGFIPKRTIIQGRLLVTEGPPPSIREMLGFHKKGVLVIVSEQKPLHLEWQQAIEKSNNLLKELGAQPFSIIYEKITTEERAYTRREVFSFLRRETQSTIKEMTPAKWRFNHENLELSKLYPNHQFAEITIATDKCTLCMACQKLCHKGVLQINDSHFTIAAQACSNCKLCQDICPESAITIEEKIKPATEVNYPTYTKVCQTCNKPFQTFQKDQMSCMICEKRARYGQFLK